MIEVGCALPIGLGLAICVLLGLALIFSIITRIVDDTPRDKYTRKQYIIYNYAYVGELFREVERLTERQLEKFAEELEER